MARKRAMSVTVLLVDQKVVSCLLRQAFACYVGEKESILHRCLRDDIWVCLTLTPF